MVVQDGLRDKCSLAEHEIRQITAALDANNDGVVSPDDIDDAALSAAGYLCWRGKDLAKPRGWMDALRAYNLSDQYARTVRDWATAYADGHSL